MSIFITEFVQTTGKGTKTLMQMTLKQAVNILHQAGFNVFNRKGLMQNDKENVSISHDMIKQACDRVDKARGYRYFQKIDDNEEIIF